MEYIKIIDFFDRLAENWDQLCNRNDPIIEYLLSLIDIKAHANILDIGTGTGVLEGYLLKYNPNRILGIDISPKMIEKAKINSQSNIASYRCVNFFDLGENSFDLAIISNSFPHLMDSPDIPATLYKLLGKRGRFAVMHSESKEKINQRHREEAAHVSTILQPAENLALNFKKLFKIEIIIDDNEKYLLSGIKK